MEHYYSLNSYLQKTFGEKVYKLSLELATTCPNRDGRLDTRGCSFCLAGSSHFATGGAEIHSQIEKAKKLVADKTKAKRFIAYFGSYTNTYGNLEHLKNVFTQVVQRPDIAALSIATRPDCLGPEVLSMLQELNAIKPVWVELGLQTANEETAKAIRRHYVNEVYVEAVGQLRSRQIEVVTHIILGLPGETLEDALGSVDLAVKAGTTGVKLQLLHVLRGTDMHKQYEAGEFAVLSLEEYIHWLFACIRRLPANIVVHRITGDAPKLHLVQPQWSADKKTVLNAINRAAAQQKLCQGADAFCGSP